MSANTLEELAEKLEGVNPQGFLKTVREYNAAVKDDVKFEHTIKDGKGTTGIEPPKSNWAQALDTPPYDAYSTTCGITFTFGGLRIVKETGQVLNVHLNPIPGLYCAGEMVGGLFYFNYASGTGLVSGAKSQMKDVKRNADVVADLVAAGPEFENYLLVGSDSREGIDPTASDFDVIGSAQDVGGQRSDTIMVMRVDPATHRPIELRMIGAAHFMTHRYSAFNAPLSLSAPG